MSPVAPSSGHASRALTLTFIAVFIGMLLVWGASSMLTSRHNQRSQTRPVGGVVDLGQAVKLAKVLDRGDGVPVFYPDVSGNNARSVYVSHRGGPVTSGWSAFLAQVPGKANDCLWEWNRTTEQFDATCDPTMHADRHGAGLTHYPVTVERGRVKVDLTVRAAPTSTAPATSVAN